jgi:hypothetical protein
MIEPRSISVSAEVSGVTESIKNLRSILRAALEAENVGEVRQIHVNVIQGTRKRKAKAGRGR